MVRATHLPTGRAVAIKLFRATYDDPTTVDTLREIQALRKLCPHPNIITLLDVVHEPPPSGRLALVFELMACNLYDIIKHRQAPLPSGLLLGYAYQLLRAVDYLHTKGVFHRDVKPENVLISGDHVLKLGDLGSGLLGVGQEGGGPRLAPRRTSPHPDNASTGALGVPLLKMADLGSCRGVYSQPPYTGAWCGGGGGRVARACASSNALHPLAPPPHRVHRDPVVPPARVPAVGRALRRPHGRVGGGLRHF